MSRVLVVEDDPTVARVVEVALGLNEHEVTVATTPREALDRLREGGQDLVVLDVNLPGASGLEILRHLREELGRDTPVIMLSALQQKDVVVRALEMGANDYVTKPFSPRELLARIKTWTARDD